MTGARDIHADFAFAARLAADEMSGRRGRRVTRDPEADRAWADAARLDLDAPVDVGAAAARLLTALTGAGVRNDHPRYFGLFNPPSLPAGAIGDLLAAAINPQLAVWSHAPGAVEIERFLVETMGELVWSRPAAGSFTSGGSEANHTVLLLALERACPDWATAGLPRRGPRLGVYVSAESHLAWIKLARAAGLGAEAVRLAPTRDGLALDAATLAAWIEQDETFRPVMICATAGTTAHGAVDDLAGLGRLAGSLDAHFHVDAAWAGAALLSPARRAVLEGIEFADTVTIDAHKWLAAPMGAGLILARDWLGLERCFGVRTGYMPSASSAHRDPYIHSLQWSRRFTGAKLWMALATLGRAGYAEMIERQFALGERLREQLSAHGWEILNRTALPLVNFAPPGAGDADVARIEREVQESGSAWISTVNLNGRLCLRACVTSFETTEDDIDALVALLEAVRGPPSMTPSVDRAPDQTWWA